MAFFQEPPRLANVFDEDPMLADYLCRVLPDPAARAITAELRELAEVAVRLHTFQLADRENEPVLTQWDPWGNRVDHIEVSPLWKEAARLSAVHGLVAAGYEPTWGEHARVVRALADEDLHTIGLGIETVVAQDQTSGRERGGARRPVTGPDGHHRRAHAIDDAGDIR